MRDGGECHNVCRKVICVHSGHLAHNVSGARWDGCGCREEGRGVCKVLRHPSTPNLTTISVPRPQSTKPAMPQPAVTRRDHTERKEPTTHGRHHYKVVTVNVRAMFVQVQKPQKNVKRNVAKHQKHGAGPPWLQKPRSSNLHQKLTTKQLQNHTNRM